MGLLSILADIVYGVLDWFASPWRLYEPEVEEDNGEPPSPTAKE